MKYFLILSVFVGISLIPTVYADGNFIKMPYAEIEPIIDGKYTLESEWNDAKLTKFQSNGHDFYMQTKQDDNFVYLFFDGVDFQADPTDNSTSVRYQVLSCFDVNADKADKKQPDDFCLIQTVYNEFGKLVRTENAELKYTSEGESLDKSMVHDYEAMWAFGNDNDKFEKSNHLSYEIKIPKESVMSKDRFGFNFRMFFGSASDDLVQLSDGVIWPPESDKDNPSTWGTLSMTKQIPSPLKQTNSGIQAHKVQCEQGLALIERHDGSAACVTVTTKYVLIERGWVKEIDLSFCKDWCDKEELLEMGCSESLLDYIHKDSNFFDDVGFYHYGFGGPNVPKRITEEKYYECADFIYEKRAASNSKILELYKDKPEVVAFYAKYPDIQEEVVSDHISYIARSEGFEFRMNLNFDKNHDITGIDFHCYVQSEHRWEHQWELDPQDILSNLLDSNLMQKIHC